MSHTITIAPKPATAISLDGFQATCPCGWCIASTSMVILQDWAREHIEWAADKAKRGRARKTA